MSDFYVNVHNPATVRALLAGMIHAGKLAGWWANPSSVIAEPADSVQKADALIVALSAPRDE